MDAGGWSRPAIPLGYFEAAAVAAGEYTALLEQLTPRAVEIIKGFFTLQNQLLDLEKIQALMKEKAASAGKLVNPVPPDGVIIIPVGAIEADV